jgi:hypothetical protein
MPLYVRCTLILYVNPVVNIFEGLYKFKTPLSWKLFGI